MASQDQTPDESNEAAIVLAHCEPFVLGPLTVDPRLRSIEVGSTRHLLEPRVMQVLVLLSRKSGIPVTRDELIERCWDGRIVGDDAIHRVISRLRILLREIAPNAVSVETVARVGYRLIVEPDSDTLTPEVQAGRHGLSIFRPMTLILSAIFVAVCALGVIAWKLSYPAAPVALAVLPFETSDRDLEPLADGFSQDLLVPLARNPGLRVIGRQSTWQYKGKSLDLRRIGRQLGVDYLVAGTLSRDRKRVLVRVSVIRASDAATTWSQSFTGATQELQPLHRAAANGIAVALDAGMTGKARAESRVDGEAYTLYLRARGLFHKRTDQSLEGAKTLLLEAVRIDPDFAPAWAYLGGVGAMFGDKQIGLPAETGLKTITPRGALERALKLDPDLADAHGFMGWVDPPNSLDGFRDIQRAVELEPNDPQILFWYSIELLNQGNFHGHAEAAARAVALDPLWKRSVTEAAAASLWQGDEVAVRRYLDRIRAVDPDGALEVESSLAALRGDWSRVVEIGLRYPARAGLQSRQAANEFLDELGFEREGRLLARGQEKIWNNDRLPDLATLLRQSTEQRDFDYEELLRMLRLEGRYRDIVALFDNEKGDMAEVRHATFANRGIRSLIGGSIAQALLKLGRKVDAQRMLRLTEDADRAVLSSGPGSSCFLVTQARNAAVAGRREEALEILEANLAKVDCLGIAYQGQADPMFENLRGNPRFEAILRRANSHWHKERREVLALGLL
ncbi:MAG: winged helix-turn-helix domain-containing protein [Novosphingobium sp.]|nr:winged helix-turn-helix domain-containing protein [Novosphingobium sp.]